MSWKALKWASEQTTGSASNKLILIALANFADDDGLCFPKISTLSKISELSERQIIRCLKDLKYNDCDYCKYGFGIRKRTRFWNNINNNWSIIFLC